MPQLERREALPVHPVPAGLAAPETWRLRVDGLVAQPLDLSVSEVEALGAQARRRISSVKRVGWCPINSGKALRWRPSWGVLACSRKRAS